MLRRDTKLPDCTTLVDYRGSRGRSGEPFLLLPGEYAVGHTFVEVGRTDDGLYTGRRRRAKSAIRGR